MRPVPRLEYPKEQQALYRRARRLEWGTVAYMVSAAVVLALTMGTSQAMRTSFFDDLLSIIPPLSFLITTKIAQRPATPEFPYGQHGAVSIGFLTSSLALLAMGAYLLIEAALKLLLVERTTIGGVTLFGRTIWAGWLMLAGLAYSMLPPILLGRAKHQLAPKLHDKVLFADAMMNRADWMTGAATAIGVVGVGFGFWWADPVVAAVVSVDIIHDGWKTLSTAVTDLIARRPEKTDASGAEPLPDRVRSFLESLDWVERAEVRLREQGHVFFGEAFVVPRTVTDLPRRLEQAVAEAKRLNWRLLELVIMPVPRLEDQPGREPTP